MTNSMSMLNMVVVNLTNKKGPLTIGDQSGG